MNIYVYTDPEYRGSLWSAQTYRAICEEAAKKKYSVRLIECEDLDTFDFDTFFSAEKRKIVLLSTDMTRTWKKIQYLNMKIRQMTFLKMDEHIQR